MLVVEDEPAVRHIIDRLLTASGHHVIAAPDVFTAMALVLDYQWKLDVALLDLSLPGMGGLAYADHFSRQFPDSRIVFMTGHVEETKIAEAERRAPVLLKPFESQQLFKAIEPS